MTTAIPAASDQVTLVNDADEVIGVMDKIEAHRGEGKLHRASSVFLFNDQGQLLVQQRSQVKIVGAEQWANTCCGNVWPGESYEACALRRLQVELGITGVSLRDIYHFQYHVRCNDEFSEREIDHVFVGVFAGKGEPNPAEVMNAEWVDWSAIKNQFQTDKYDRDWAPWFEIMMKNEELQIM